MNSRFGRRTSNTVQIRPASAVSKRPPDSSSPAFETRDQSTTAQELTEAWDVDVLRLKLIRPGLKPLSADELEFLVSRFPDVMPQVYVRPHTILFGMANRQGYLMQVARQDLGFPGDVPIQIVYARGRIDVWKWCGDIERTVDVIAFNKLRVKAIRQTLAPLPGRHR